MKQLTIAITTYNRKDSLIKQLQRIEGQKQIDKYDLIISDNHSSYDLNVYLKVNLSKEFYENIQLHINLVNIGGLGNISNIFMLPKTKWMWLLSDDDEVTPNSIESIVSDIQQYPNTGVLKYSIINDIQENDTAIHNIDELTKYYLKEKHSVGSLIFMSNNIYNLERIRSFIPYIYNYSYSYIPHINPILAGLAKGELVMQFLNTAIVHYVYPGRDNHWNYVPTMLGLSTIEDMDLGWNIEQQNKLMCILASNFQHLLLYKYCLEIGERRKRLNVYEKIYRSFYSHRKHLSDVCFYFMFHMQYYTGVNMILVGQRIKRILGITN